MRAAWALAGVLFLIVPTAAAQAASGKLVATGAIELSDGVHASLDADAFYVDELGGRPSITLVAERLIIHNYTTRTLATARGEVVIEKTSGTDRFGGVSGSVRGRENGWLGVYSTDGGVVTSFSTASLRVVASATPTIGNTAPPERDPQPGRNGFGPALDAPALLFDGEGETTLSGDLLFKISGADLTVDAGGEKRTYASGREDAPAQRTYRWLYVEAQRARLTVSGDAPVTIAGPRGSVAMDGAVEATFVSGAIETGGGAYAASGQRARISGAWNLTLAPSGAEQMEVGIQGVLRDTTLQLAANAPVPLAPGGTLRWSLLLVLALVAGAGTGVALQRRRQVRDVGVDELVTLADRAAETGQFEEALRWIQRARKFAPTSDRLLLDEAFLCAETGDDQRALTLYATASAKGTDGEADFLAAALCLRMGKTHEAGTHLIGALERTPSLAFEVEDDAAFAPVRSDPRVREALRRAAQDDAHQR